MILFPPIFCFMPAMFIVILGPAMISITEDSELVQAGVPSSVPYCGLQVRGFCWYVGAIHWIRGAVAVSETAGLVLAESKGNPMLNLYTDLELRVRELAARPPATRVQLLSSTACSWH